MGLRQAQITRKSVNGPQSEAYYPGAPKYRYLASTVGQVHSFRIGGDTSGIGASAGRVLYGYNCGHTWL